MKKEAINKALESMHVEEFRSKEDSWATLQNRMNASADRETPIIEMPRKSNRKLWLAVGSVAAILVAAAVFFIPKGDIQVDTGYAAMKKVELPDGSVVHLNASSHLSYDADDWEHERSVELKGEAEFEVEKGSSFKVRSESGVVEVLGTSFNVYDRKGEYEVSCMTGKVSVENESGKVIILPGEQVVEYDNGNLEKKPITGKPAGWIDGEYYFEEVSALRVFRLLEFTYGIEIDHNQWSDAKTSIYAGPVVTTSLSDALMLIGGQNGSLPIEFIETGDNTYQVQPLEE